MMVPLWPVGAGNKIRRAGNVIAQQCNAANIPVTR